MSEFRFSSPRGVSTAFAFLSVVALVAAMSVLAAAPLAAQGGQGGVAITSETFGGLSARAIGPAVTGGRIAAVTGVPGDPATLWVGAAGGGVWKSINGGTTFTPVFDKHTQSIGAIAVDPKHHDTIWVGTGESWTRNSVSVGTGVYKSIDGGSSWKMVGLADSEHVARIVIDPQKTDTVYVCALGHLWNDNEQRGVFKSEDGGKSWKKVLYVDAKTGCSDLAMDPQDPQILYAGMWQFRRYPDFFQSGGPGSALYRSTDGGAHWSKLEQGLPKGEKGRIAVAVAPSRPSVVYALVEAKQTALYRSEDLGEHWKQVNTSFNVIARPFYFATLIVDPSDFNRVYKPGFSLSVSNDGGHSFTSPFTSGFGGSVHSDLHTLWIDPQAPRELLLGTDGGVYRSFDAGGHWRHLAQLPVSQFYHVSYDLDWPYHVYGGLQDNGTWMGPSRAVGGIRNRDWRNIGMGDGMWAFVDPKDPDYVYDEYQGGNIFRFRRSTGESKSIRPYAEAGEAKLRFNWNAPIAVSPNHPGTIYLGAQYLFRSSDRGESWQRISPDLTTNNPKFQRQDKSGGLTIDNSTAENYTTIYAIAESPKNDQVIWVGTDDGNLQVTQDGGKSWKNVVGNVPDLPKLTWVSHVYASPYDQATAFVTFDGHRTGDMKTYLYVTHDFGTTWKSLVTPDIHGFAHTVLQDPVDPDLLFLGTEFGLYVSLDGGSHWARFASDLPPVPVRGLAVQPKSDDLLIATYGRGIYILDDLTPLRHLTAANLASKVAMLPSRPAVMVLNNELQDFPGDAEFVGQNPPEAAPIVYYLKKRHIFGDLRVEIYDSHGKKISTLPGGRRRGINRVEWPMRLAPPKVPPANSLAMAFIGPRVPEGTYTVKLIKGAKTYTSTVTLVPDPRNDHSAADRALQQTTTMALYHDLGHLTYLVDAVIDMRDQARTAAKEVGAKSRWGRRLTGYADELDGFRKTLVAAGPGGMLSGEEKLRENLADLYGSVSAYDGKPSDSQLARQKDLEAKLASAEKHFAGLSSSSRLAPFNRVLERHKKKPLTVLSHEAWEKKQKEQGGGTLALGEDGESLGALVESMTIALGSL